MSWWVYLLRCGDGTLYTGITDDLDRRLAAHNAGRGAKYTRSRRPVTLVWREEQPDKSAALRREYAVKQLTRAKKLALIEGGRLCRWCFKTFTAYGAETKDVRSASDEPLDLPKF